MHVYAPLVVAVLMFGPLVAAGVLQSNAERVARQIEDRPAGRDSRMTMRMRLFDRQARARERGLTIAVLRGRPGAGPDAPDGDRVLVRFTQPSDIRGTSFLVRERPDAAAGGGTGSGDERFLYLPALGRVRRIAGSERQESFVGTDFTYEDIGGREFDDYRYVLLDENASWRAPDGTAHAAYRLESRARDADAVYPRVVSLVRKDNFVVVHADVHDRRGEQRKVFDVTRLERVQGIWTSLAMVMKDELEGTRTELSVTEVQYNVGLTDDDMSRRELERGVR
jgi:hypothetical protein